MMPLLRNRPLECRMHLLSKISRAGKMVLDTCSRALGTAKIYIKLPGDRRFPSFKSALCFRDTLPLFEDLY